MKMIAAAVVALAAVSGGQAEAATWRADFDVVEARMWFRYILHETSSGEMLYLPETDPLYQYVLHEGYDFGQLLDTVIGPASFLLDDNPLNPSVECLSGALCSIFPSWADLVWADRSMIASYGGIEWTARFDGSSGRMEFFDDARIADSIPSPDGNGTLSWWGPQGEVTLANLTWTEIAAVPLPASGGLMLIGVGLLSAVRRLRSRPPVNHA